MTRTNDTKSLLQHLVCGADTEVDIKNANFVVGGNAAGFTGSGPLDDGSQNSGDAEIVLAAIDDYMPLLVPVLDIAFLSGDPTPSTCWTMKIQTAIHRRKLCNAGSIVREDTALKRPVHRL